MFCEKCGNEIKVGAKFCEECGAAIETKPAKKNQEFLSRFFIFLSFLYFGA